MVAGMCLLIVVRGCFGSHPILVAANRDERTDRKSAPPGLWVGQHRRVLSPRDRVAGGTWLAVGEHGLFAGLTNISAVPPPPGAASRGELPHLALDAADLDAGARAVQEAVAARRYGGFQLVLASAEQTVVLRYQGAQLERIEWGHATLVITNEHAPGALTLRGLDAALQPASDAAGQLELLRPLLLDRGDGGGHPSLKQGQGYGTVSASLIAVPATPQQPLLWRYAAGSPDRAPFQSYGNLQRRLYDAGDVPRDG